MTEQTTLDRARAAAMERLGWEDDRDNDDEYAGALWDAATEVAQAVIDVVEADRQLADAARAVAAAPTRCPELHPDGVTRCHDDTGHGIVHGGTGPHGPKTWSGAA